MEQDLKSERTIEEERRVFERTNDDSNSEVLIFQGVPQDKDVYNCSIPLEYKGKTYILGRVEPRKNWADSVTSLFVKKEDGRYHIVHEFNGYGLEDPFWTIINGEYIFGGNIVFKTKGVASFYATMFYRSDNLFDWKHFAVGPGNMKDIRLVQLPEHKVGVFSRPRDKKMIESYGSESLVGFTVLDSIDELTDESILNAPYINNFFHDNEWGGVNQAIYLGGDYIGLVGHHCYNYKGTEVPVYINTAYVYDMKQNTIVERKVIGSRRSYPKTPSKTPQLFDCAFTSGIIIREDGMADLYSGLSDAYQGRKTIRNPFEKYMNGF